MQLELLFCLEPTESNADRWATMDNFRAGFDRDGWYVVELEGDHYLAAEVDE